LVASPGCYAVGAILATAPLLKNGLARLEGIVVDGKSGVSGAGAQGRKVDPMYLYTEANENVQAYSIGGVHRHTAEIEQELSALAGETVRVSFTPHLLPLTRGLFTTASVLLATPLGTAELVDVYREFYAGEPFVRVLGESERPTTRSVVGSNYCDVTVVADPRTGRAVCVSAIDQLGKGGPASGVPTNQLKGASVLVSMGHARACALQTIVVTSGCSNVCNGERGLKDAREIVKQVADLLRVPSSHVLVGATGVIGHPLPM